MNPTELILKSNARSVAVNDDTGRLLTVRALTALDRLRLLKAAGPELSQNDAWLNMAALVVSVSEINQIPKAMPVNERQIEQLIAELGDPGLSAVADALAEMAKEDSVFGGPSEGNVVGTPT